MFKALTGTIDLASAPSSVSSREGQPFYIRLPESGRAINSLLVDQNVRWFLNFAIILLMYCNWYTIYRIKNENTLQLPVYIYYHVVCNALDSY